jgi:hypothetical protein
VKKKKKKKKNVKSGVLEEVSNAEQASQLTSSSGVASWDVM